MGIRFDSSLALKQIDIEKLEEKKSLLQQAHSMLHNHKGPGNDYTGWLDWPLNYNRDEFTRIKKMAQKIRENGEVFLVIGIGGSYLGARSAIEFLQTSHYNLLNGKKGLGPEIYFIGNNTSPSYLYEIFQLIAGREVYVNVISKSGTTMEPAIAFRMILQYLEERYGKELARDRIIVTTDPCKGALKKIADEKGYETFSIPQQIGGRYSVLTAVGLLPMAVAGIDIDQVIAGAKDAFEKYREDDLDGNDCYQYAIIRNELYWQGKTIEILVNYDPSLQFFSEWWKQLFGESEGKEGKGIFPASVSFSTDLHSMGQYIQDGRRDLFTTNIWIEKSEHHLTIPKLSDVKDNLDQMVGISLHDINRCVCKGAMTAHAQGGVPVLKVEIPEKSPYYYGQLVYFFEKACAISGYLLGVNPFDQPGVEAYKRNVYQFIDGITTKN